MPINVIAHDTNLIGRTPLSTAGTIAFEVDEHTRMRDFIARTLTIADEHNGIRNLYIMAHGVTVRDERTSAIQFTGDMISFRTIHMFQQLRDKIDRIILFVCHAAETDLTEFGDGDELCRQMAMNAHAEVTAAREVQAYLTVESCQLFSCEESAIEFGEWEGPVVVYNREGMIIAQYNNPSSWRDADGVVHDPRVDPNPHPYRDGEGATHATRH